MSKYKSKPNIDAYPHCAGRGILVTFADGIHGGPTHSEHRVDFNRLMGALSPAEHVAWDRCTWAFPSDEHGILPEQVEQFLSTLSENKDMAAATKEKAARKPRQKKDKEGGAAVAEKTSSGGHDPAQPSLPTIESDRIAGVETCIKRVLNNQKERKRLKEEIDEDKTKIAILLKKNDRTQYKALGKLFIVVPGADILQIKSIKDK